jgi:Glycosyl transferase family 2
MPRFSICIPTRGRAETLRHTLATAAGQVDADVEIVVQNNGGDESVRAVVAELGDPRVRHFATDNVISMTANWELAVANATGEILVVLGADDGLLPDACRLAQTVFDTTSFELLSWWPFWYFWPDYFDPRRRNRLEAAVEPELNLQALSSRALLESFYRFEAHYSHLPMIYNSFVRRPLIERVRARHGRYFFGALPDVTSGIVNAAVSDAFVRCSRPLSVTGTSGQSLGHRNWVQPDAAPDPSFERDFPPSEQRAIPISTSSMDLSIASEMLFVREHVLADDPELALDYGALARHLAQSINERPDRYAEALSAIEALIEEHGIARKDIAIPPRASQSQVTPIGVHPAGSASLHVIDGKRAGLRTIADAVRLASELLPDGEPVWAEEPERLGLANEPAPVDARRPGRALRWVGRIARPHRWRAPRF